VIRELLTAAGRWCPVLVEAATAPFVLALAMIKSARILKFESSNERIHLLVETFEAKAQSFLDKVDETKTAKQFRSTAKQFRSTARVFRSTARVLGAILSVLGVLLSIVVFANFVYPILVDTLNALRRGVVAIGSVVDTQARHVVEKTRAALGARARPKHHQVGVPSRI